MREIRKSGSEGGEPSLIGSPSAYRRPQYRLFECLDGGPAKNHTQAHLPTPKGLEEAHYGRE